MSNQIKKAPVEGDHYIRINSSITVAEDYLPAGQKNDAINKANQKMKEGDKKRDYRGPETSRRQCY